MDLSKIVIVVVNSKMRKIITINMTPITAPSVMIITGLDKVASIKQKHKINNIILEDYIHTNHKSPMRMFCYQ